MSQRYYTCPIATLMDSYARRIRLSGPTASTLSGRDRAEARHRRPYPTLALPPCPKRGSRNLCRRSRSPPLCKALPATCPAPQPRVRRSWAPLSSYPPRPSAPPSPPCPPALRHRCTHHHSHPRGRYRQRTLLGTGSATAPVAGHAPECLCAPTRGRVVGLKALRRQGEVG